jgi:hypothetical protein
MVLAPFEHGMLEEIRDLDCQRDKDIQPILDDKAFWTPEEQDQVQQAAKKLSFEMIEEAHLAFLGYYAGKVDVMDLNRHELPKAAMNFSAAFHPHQPIHVSTGMMSKLGLLRKQPVQSRRQAPHARNQFQFNNRSKRGWEPLSRDMLEAESQLADMDEDFESTSHRVIRRQREQSRDMQEMERKRMMKRDRRFGGKYEPRNMGTPDFHRDRRSQGQQAVRVTASQGTPWYDEQ